MDYGTCGIITVCLSDPYSILISRLYSSNMENPTCIGFYHSKGLYLFNIHNNHPFPLRETTIDGLLHSNILVSGKVYPLIVSKTASPHLLTRSNISPTIRQVQITEDIFRSTCLDVITQNSHRLVDKVEYYTEMLLGNIESLVHTGYTVVNQILSNLMGLRYTPPIISNNTLIQSPFLGKPIAITQHYPINNTHLDEINREVSLIATIGTDLFKNNEAFRMRTMKIDTSDKSINLGGLWRSEEELVRTIVDGVHVGTISNTVLNERIGELNRNRALTGYYARLPLSMEPKNNVVVTESAEPILCTFSDTKQSTDNMSALRNMGSYISHIIDSFDDPSALTINLGALISTYNEITRGTELPQIDPPRTGGHSTISRYVTLTLPGDDGIELSNIPISSKAINIPMYGANLSILSKEHLIDILVYIDSMRANDGSTDTRYANLQNAVVHELARRR